VYRDDERCKWIDAQNSCNAIIAYPIKKVDLFSLVFYVVSVLKNPMLPEKYNTNDKYFRTSIKVEIHQKM